ALARVRCCDGVCVQETEATEHGQTHRVRVRNRTQSRSCHFPAGLRVYCAVINSPSTFVRVSVCVVCVVLVTCSTSQTPLACGFIRANGRSRSRAPLRSLLTAWASTAIGLNSCFLTSLRALCSGTHTWRDC